LFSISCGAAKEPPKLHPLSTRYFLLLIEAGGGRFSSTLPDL
jgi:hypothetical protein